MRGKRTREDAGQEGSLVQRSLRAFLSKFTPRSRARQNDSDAENAEPAHQQAAAITAGEQAAAAREEQLPPPNFSQFACSAPMPERLARALGTNDGGGQRQRHAEAAALPQQPGGHPAGPAVADSCQQKESGDGVQQAADAPALQAQPPLQPVKVSAGDSAAAPADIQQQQQRGDEEGAEGGAAGGGGSDGAAGPAGGLAGGLTDYELQRLERIRRNQEVRAG